MSSTRFRSSSRSRTTIGYSLPSWRKNAACVPPTLVRMLLATPLTLRPSSAAFGRSTMNRQLRAAVVAADAHVAHFRDPVHDGLRLDRQPLRHREVVAADFERQPAVVAAAAPAAPPPSRRVIAWLPPEARVVMMTPGMTPASCRFSVRAISSLERVRSAFGMRRMVACVRLALPPPNPPPPPAWVMMASCSLTYSGRSDSRRTATSCARSMRVPTGSSAVTCTSPSSVTGISSNPIVGRMSAATTTQAVPAADDGRPVVERAADQAAVAVVHAVEEPFARRIHAADDALPLGRPAAAASAAASRAPARS